MAGLTVKKVLSYFVEKGIEVTEMEEDILRVGCEFNGGSVALFFQFGEDDIHLRVDGINFLMIPKDKIDNIYRIINECNDTYLYVKYILDEKHGQVIVRSSAILQQDTCGEECYELLVRMVKSIDDEYPKFMKSIWMFSE